MKSHILSTVGAVIGGVAASLCCIGPVVLAGAGTAGLLAGFWDYRPYLLPITPLLLGIAFYYTYKKREIACEDGTCKIESAGKWNKIGVWIAAVFVTVMIAVPYLGFSPAPAFDETVNPTMKVVVNIEGMTCVTCPASIEKSLGGEQSIREAAVSYQDEKGIIN